MSDLELVVEQELRLLEPEQAEHPERVRDLFHPYFSDFAVTGNVFDRDTVLTLALDESNAALTVDNIEAEQLADTVILVTYRSHRSDRQALRSSVWVLEDGRWLLRHHQATPTRQRSA